MPSSSSIKPVGTVVSDVVSSDSSVTELSESSPSVFSSVPVSEAVVPSGTEVPSVPVVSGTEVPSAPVLSGTEVFSAVVISPSVSLSGTVVTAAVEAAVSVSSARAVMGPNGTAENAIAAARTDEMTLLFMEFFTLFMDKETSCPFFVFCKKMYTPGSIFLSYSIANFRFFCNRNRIRIITK